MTEPDFRALAQELFDQLSAYDGCDDVEEVSHHWNYTNCNKLLYRARAALATPPPDPPTDKELNALWNRCGTADDYGNYYEGNIFKFARAVLEFQRIIK